MVALFLAHRLLLVAALAWSVAHCIRTLRRPVAALAPLAIMGVTFVLVASGFLQYVVMRTEFRWHAPERQRVLELVDHGHLAVDPTGRLRGTTALALPAAYRGLSWDQGRIWVYERDGARHVVFPTTTGMFQEFTAYLHRNDGQYPAPPAGYLHGPAFAMIIPLGGGWYWVTAG